MIGMYPIMNPMHGGQLRVRAIYDAYIRNGIDVKYFSVSPVGAYESFWADDQTFQSSSYDENRADIITGDALYKDSITRNRLIDTIKKYRPNVIQFEQSFGYIGFEKLINETKWFGKIIYSSQNIEFKLKGSILNSKVPKLAEDVVDKVIRQVRVTEKNLVKRADLVIACTDEDATQLRTMGAKNIVVARNGINDKIVDKDNLWFWDTNLTNEGINKKILFVGSAHPPNLYGFRDMVGYSLGFLPKTSRLLVVGGVCNLILGDLRNIPNYIAETFVARVKLLGKVSEKDLASLIKLADVIILPITSGGGSNLKTAEAILSCNQIVATRLAFRSFEEYMVLNNVTLTDEPNIFRLSMISQAKKGKDISQPERDLSQTVTWDYTLQSLLDRVGSL